MIKVALLGLFRNSKKYISNCISQFENLENIKGYCFDFYLYENDSKDNTLETLRKWSDNKKNVNIFTETLGVKSFQSNMDIDRLSWMGYFRNKNKNRIIKDYDLYLLVDTDLFFSNADFMELIKAKNEYPNGVMFTANCRQNLPDLMLGETQDSYYDCAALKDKYGNSSLFFTNCPLLLEEDRVVFYRNEPIEIQSGFGGLAIVSGDAFKKAKWSTTGNSEHVNFCIELSKYGDIYLVPSCTPKVNIDFEKYDISQFRENAARQLHNMNFISKFYKHSISN